jgi:CRISPR/Cas system-associated endonuclease Cas1
MEEDSIMHESFSNSIFQEEDFQDVIESNDVNSMNVYSFDVSISSCAMNLLLQNLMKIRLHMRNYSCRSIVK